MELGAAIKSLHELVGHVVTVNPSGEPNDAGAPFRVTAIDFFANRELRCIVGRTAPDGNYRSMRRPVADITRDRKYFEADTTVATASLEDVRRAVESHLKSTHNRV